MLPLAYPSGDGGKQSLAGATARDGKLEAEPEPPGDGHSKSHDRSADHEHREAVADAPKNARPRRAANAALLADDVRNGDDVIGVGGVAHAEKKAEQKNREQRDHPIAG